LDCVYVMKLWTIIPAQNEEKTIGHVVESCLVAGSHKVLVICNGCTDKTLELVATFPQDRVLRYVVDEPLGLDIPKSLGAYIAYLSGADCMLFCDGDLSGKIDSHLATLFGSMTWGYDLSLSDCYPRGLPGTGMAGKVISARLSLNRAIGRADLGAAVMSHGPSCISRRFLDTLPPHVLGIPPLAQALAVKKGLIVKIGAVIAHGLLGSRERHGSHSDGITDLIIGDCLFAEAVFHGGLPARCSPDGIPHIGFDRNRRWDLLNAHLRRIREEGLLPNFTPRK